MVVPSPSDVHENILLQSQNSLCIHRTTNIKLVESTQILRLYSLWTNVLGSYRLAILGACKLQRLLGMELAEQPLCLHLPRCD